MCGRGLRAALAFSFLSAPGRRDGCAATVTKKKKRRGGGLLLLFQSGQGASKIPPASQEFTFPFYLPLPSSQKRLLLLFYFFSFCHACHFDSCRPGHLWRARRTDTERAFDTIDGKTNGVIPALTALPPARVRDRNGARGSAEVCAWKGQGGRTET